LTILVFARTLLVVRQQRVTTPDGRIWYVRRRWARRQPPWRRRPDHELGPAEVDEVPLLPADEVAESFLDFVRHDLQLGLALLLGLAVLGLVAAVAGAVLVVERVVPFLVDHAAVIGAGLAGLAALVLVDRLTRPWFIEAESGRMFKAPRRVWRVHGWWRARRAFRVVVEAVAEGRIDSEHGVIMFTDPSAAP
jgi:hypothetical protein